MSTTMKDINSIPYDIPDMWEDYTKSFHAKGITFPRIAIHGNGGKNNMGDALIHKGITKVDREESFL